MLLAAIILTAIILLKTIFACKNLFLSFKGLYSMRKSSEQQVYNNEYKKKLLIMIPALREQSIIEKTLSHFSQFQIQNIDIHLAIVGTYKEVLSKRERRKEIESSYKQYKESTTKSIMDQILRGLFCDDLFEMLWNERDNIGLEKFKEIYDNQPSTREVVEEWIKNKKDTPMKFYYLESPNSTGDRATQLNYGLKYFTNNIEENIDVVGVYDADSLPEKNTFYEVIKEICTNKAAACQQPLHFIDKANDLVLNKKNPILVASALYQTTWSMIKELPNLLMYSKHCEKHPNKFYKRNLYLNGHGEFFSKDLLCKIGGFPEGIITDGVQIGYRLAMINAPIKPISSFCSDDLPISIKEIITQHIRWYGGCMELKSSYDWSKKYAGQAPWRQLLDGYHLQLAWAFAPLVVIITFISILVLPDILVKKILLSSLITSVVVYNFLLPRIAHKIIGINLKVRLIDWLCLPIAILLKSIGPNIYFLKRIVSYLKRTPIKYKKVER